MLNKFQSCYCISFSVRNTEHVMETKQRVSSVRMEYTLEIIAGN